MAVLLNVIVDLLFDYCLIYYLFLPLCLHYISSFLLVPNFAFSFPLSSFVLFVIFFSFHSFLFTLSFATCFSISYRYYLDYLSLLL